MRCQILTELKIELTHKTRVFLDVSSFSNIFFIALLPQNHTQKNLTELPYTYFRYKTQFRVLSFTISTLLSLLHKSFHIPNFCLFSGENCLTGGLSTSKFHCLCVNRKVFNQQQICWLKLQFPGISTAKLKQKDREKDKLIHKIRHKTLERNPTQSQLKQYTEFHYLAT